MPDSEVVRAGLGPGFADRLRAGIGNGSTRAVEAASTLAGLDAFATALRDLR